MTNLKNLGLVGVSATVLFLAAQAGFGSAAPAKTVEAKPVSPSSSISELDPEKKQALKQMATMSGRIEKTCDSRDPDSCLSHSVNLSDVAVKGEPAADAQAAPAAGDSSKLKADERLEVVKNLSKDCKTGAAASCKRLALISKEMNKPRTSIQLFKMACEHGDTTVCRELSASLERAGKKDLAALYMQKACRRGDTAACQPATAPANN